MPKTITFACWDYDRVLPVLDGRVPVEGFTVAPVILKPADLFPRVLQRKEFDVSELSLSSYLLQVSRGESDYTAIPVFTSRAFRHASIYVNSDSGIETPKHLEGRRVGIPEYQMTLVVWARGMLQDEYGVDFRKLKYRTGATNYAGLKERLPLTLPPQIDIEPIPADKSANDMLLEDRLDAIISPTPPDAFTAGNPKVRLLLNNIRNTERNYFLKTGIFPIMHTVVIKKSLVSEYPALATRLFKALVKAKNLALQSLDIIARAPAIKISLPWLPDELAETKKIMGDNYWRYGVDANRAALEAMCRYSHEQYLSRSLLRVEELFVPETLALSDAEVE
jgi:4,5-dihydroxyphthalate decarboxylase